MAEIIVGKVALVTGGGRDIGRAISTTLAAAGAAVVVNYCSDADAAEETVRRITGEGGEAIAVRADLRQAEAVRRLVEETIARFGALDILVNNAGGLLGRRRLEEMDGDFFDATLRLNLTSTFRATQAARPHLRRGASVINIASIAAKNGGGMGASAYAAAKAGLLGFTKALSRELGPDGIRVNALCPGLIGTSFHDRFSTAEGRAGTVAATSLRREGVPGDVAGVVLFLACESAAFITGSWIDVDGGS